MDAWKYHNKCFQEDIRKFFGSLERGPRERNSGDGIVRDPQYSFHLEDLLGESPRPNHLAHVLPQNLASFAASLTYLVLINQIVHAHFPQLHEQFWQLARYPLVAGGMNPTQSPYSVLEHESWTKRGVHRTQLVEAWQELVGHLQDDIREFETKQAKGLGITWAAFRDGALNDSGVVVPEPWGSIVRNALK